MKWHFYIPTCHGYITTLTNSMLTCYMRPGLTYIIKQKRRNVLKNQWWASTLHERQVEEEREIKRYSHPVVGQYSVLSHQFDY